MNVRAQIGSALQVLSQLGFIMKAKAIDAAETAARLDALVGTDVSVTWSRLGAVANHFDTAISVRAKLEKHPENGSYRVLLSSDIYSYFTVGDVLALSQFSKGWRVFLQ